MNVSWDCHDLARQCLDQIDNVTVQDIEELGRTLQNACEAAYRAVSVRNVSSAKLVAAVLTKHGLSIRSPDEAVLGEVEEGWWNTCVEIAEALTRAIAVKRVDGGG